MIAASYIFIVLFISIMFEVMVGSAGVIFPLTSISLFYFGMVYGWRTGLFLGFFSGLVIDMLYGRDVPISALSHMAVSGVVIFWLLKGETKDFLLHVFPGIIVSALAVIPLMVVQLNGIILYGGWNILFLLLFSLVAGGITLPLLVFFLDLISELLGMELYRKARENIEERI